MNFSLKYTTYNRTRDVHHVCHRLAFDNNELVAWVGEPDTSKELYYLVMGITNCSLELTESGQLNYTFDGFRVVPGSSSQYFPSIITITGLP